MNKRRLAAFVEGQTELVFVREFLKQWYGYDASVIGFACYSLQNNEFRDAEYQYGRILSRLAYLVSQGYQLVIGLRDMYSKQYVQDAGGHVIDEKVNRNPPYERKALLG